MQERRKAMRMREVVDFARSAQNQGSSPREVADFLRMEFVPINIALRIIAGRIIEDNC